MNSPLPLTTLSEVVNASKAWDDQFSELSVSGEEFSFSAEGIAHQGQTFPMDQSGRNRLFHIVGAPARYFETHDPEFQAAAFNEHAKRGDFGSDPTLVLRNNQLVTITRGDLLQLTNSAVLGAVEETLGKEGETLTLARIGKGSEQLDIELVTPSKAIEVRVGDVVQSGLHIVHDRFGAQPTLVEAFLYRLVCSNGMTHRECTGKEIKRTRKLPKDYPNAEELQMQQIRRLTRQTWSGLQAELEALSHTRDLSADVEQVLIRWLQRARMSPKVMLARLLEAWRAEGGENTRYAAVNALTNVATHDDTLSVRQRRALATLSGILAFSHVHLCERCFSVLASATSEHHGSALDQTT